MSEPGCDKGCMFAVVEDLGKVWVGQLEVVGICGSGLVGCDYGLVEVGGNYASVYVVS